MPASIDVVDFARARGEEIRLLKKDIEDAKYRGARRVFQTLPRAMRRRAASHNLKRLPTRLRSKAVEEMLKDPTSVQKERKKPPCRRRWRRTHSIQAMAVQRQRGKRWLETHIWHAKRAKMADLWGFRLALHPNEKCLRSCLRAALSEDPAAAPFLHDASYEAALEVAGPLRAMLACLGDAVFGDLDWDPHLALCHGQASLYDGSHRLVCPLRYVLRSDGKGLAAAWIMVHPAAKEEAVGILRAKLELFPDVSGPVDMTGQLNILQLTGAGALRVLQTVLRPVAESGLSRDDWLQLAGARHPVELLVEDPRFRLQPKPEHAEAVPHPPSAAPAQSPARPQPLQNTIWDGELRAKCAELRKGDAELNALRSKQAIPGTALVPSDDDPFVPALLVPAAAAPHQWTLIIPKDWGRPFWRALVFSKVRFGGLEQVAKLAQELRQPAFPYDFPGTRAYEGWMERYSRELERTYLAKPPAKRVNYEKMRAPSPFRPPFPPSAWILPSTRFQALLGDPSPALDDYEDALLLGSLVCQGKGHPDFNAIITASEDSDEPIGFVTTGFYSVRAAKGVGIAACSAVDLLRLVKGKAQIEVPVWVRNTNSFTRRAAVFRLHQE
jgi:ribonuclease P/MRP protein subunit POP1